MFPLSAFPTSSWQHGHSFYPAWNLSLQVKLHIPLPPYGYSTHLSWILTLQVRSSFHTDVVFTLLDSWHAVLGSWYAWTPSHLTQALTMHARPSCLNSLFSVFRFWSSIAGCSIRWRIIKAVWVLTPSSGQFSCPHSGSDILTLWGWHSHLAWTLRAYNSMY